jgi:ketosteroid isomerase-like protein
MSGFDYDAYIRDFNSGEDADLVERWFDPDVVFIGTTRKYEGRDALLGFLQWAHDGVREIIRPITVLQQGDRLFAEVDMDFVASKPRDDFPFAKLRPGDLITVKFFVLYRIRDGRVIELKSMTWPTDYEVTKAPRLGGHPGQRASFIAYTTAFSAGDGARFGQYYTDDVVLELPSAPRIEGRQGIVDFYSAMFVRVREHLTVNHLVMDDQGIAADVISTFVAHEDAPDFQVRPLRKGESVAVRVFVYYRLREGRICHIRVARAGEPEFRGAV